MSPAPATLNPKRSPVLIPESVVEGLAPLAIPDELPSYIKAAPVLVETPEAPTITSL
jgi:hypothetical protein